MHKELRLFFVCFSDGRFHSSTIDQDIAWDTAREIGGLFGELVNVQRPEVAPPAVAKSVIHALNNPEMRARRDRPKAA